VQGVKMIDFFNQQEF